jgi:hypothetical protein
VTGHPFSAPRVCCLETDVAQPSHPLTLSRKKKDLTLLPTSHTWGHLFFGRQYNFRPPALGRAVVFECSSTMPVSLHSSDASTGGPEVHTIDPNGDVVLALTRYVRFEDEEVVREPDSAERTLEARISPFCISAKPAELAQTSWHTEEGEEGDKTNDELRQPVSRRQSTSSSAAIESSADSSFCLEEVIIRASSRHLTFASPVFRAMLERKFSESNTLRMTGSVEIPLPGDDPDALLIVLNAVHGRFRKIPLTVDLETLTQIAVTVDKYDLLEPVELLADFWFDNLKPSIPEVYTDDIPSWICICWVLNKPAEFEQVTRIAMRRGRGNLPSAGLPIPQPVIGTYLSSRRGRATGIGRLLGSIQMLSTPEERSVWAISSTPSMKISATTWRGNTAALNAMHSCSVASPSGSSLSKSCQNAQRSHTMDCALRTSTTGSERACISPALSGQARSIMPTPSVLSGPSNKC